MPVGDTLLLLLASKGASTKFNTVVKYRRTVQYTTMTGQYTVGVVDPFCPNKGMREGGREGEREEIENEGRYA